MKTHWSNYLKKAKRVVIKVGSSLLTNDQGLREKYVLLLSRTLAKLHAQNKEVVLVSSGAIACGMLKLKLTKRPTKLNQKQAIAAIGQPELMHLYTQSFRKKNITTAQVLLTADDLAHRQRFLNAKQTLRELFALKVIPIINENDSLAFDEIEFGDNDQLSAMVSHLVRADLLLILTDIDGFYETDPRTDSQAKKIELIESFKRAWFTKNKPKANGRTVGGMYTKLLAARKASRFGIATLILDGEDPKILNKVFNGQNPGTLILPTLKALKAKRYWLEYLVKPKGKIVVDAGALKALIEKKSSLLSGGISAIKGSFHRGDAVLVIDTKQKIIAHGLVNYSSHDLVKIKGKKSKEIQEILGYRFEDEIIHRDHLALLDNSL